MVHLPVGWCWLKAAVSTVESWSLHMMMLYVEEGKESNATLSDLSIKTLSLRKKCKEMESPQKRESQGNYLLL